MKRLHVFGLMIFAEFSSIVNFIYNDLCMIIYKIYIRHNWTIDEVIMCRCKTDL